jgi:hypothetical protein
MREVRSMSHAPHRRIEQDAAAAEQEGGDGEL